MDDSDEAATEAPGAVANVAEGIKTQLRRLEQLLEPGRQVLETAQERILVPAWRRVTVGEPRWHVSLAVVAAIGLQVVLPAKLAFHPRWLLPVLEGLLLVGLIAANPDTIDKESPRLRVASIILIAAISIANAWSALHLVLSLVRGTNVQDPGPLLITGGAIWLTNVIVFGLWYWELDRGGPVARAHAAAPHPDYLFAQMQSPELAPDDGDT
jgi:hypothetical protein